MKKIAIKKRGFSLVELLVTATLVGIMATIALVSMNAAREKKTVEVAAREIASVVREAQNYSLTGKNLKTQAASCNFVFTWTENTYSLSGCKEQGYSLKNSVAFSNSGSFYFDVPFASITVTTNPLPSPVFPIDIILNKGNSDYHVCIFASGIVREQLDSC